MKAAFSAGKFSLLILYVCAAMSPFLVSLQPYSMVLLLVSFFVILSHVAEYMAMKVKITELQRPDQNHFAMTLLFGFFHWLPFLIAQNAQQDDS